MYSPNKHTQDFGLRCSVERVRRRLSRKDLASRVGTSQQSVKRLEEGEQIKLEVACRIAMYLDVPVVFTKDEKVRRVRMAEARSHLRRLNELIGDGD